MKLLVIGDYIEDSYVFGSAVRLCPEAPVPVLIPQIRRESPGGAGLVAEQLRELGAETIARYGSFSKKLRYFAGNHLICRVDEDATVAEWDAPIEPSIEYVDAIVVSDYGKGAMSEGLAEKLRDSGKPLFVDAKQHWGWYRCSHSTAFPNEHETVGPIYEWKQVAWKRGAKGCELWCDHPTLSLPATVSEVVDTTGAGDIFMAGFVYAWTLQLLPEYCLRFANSLAGESCRHVGTYVVPKEFAQSILDRLRASRESQPPSPSSFRNSILRANELGIPLDQYLSTSTAASICLPPADSQVEIAKKQGWLQILDFAQTPPESPSTPIESPGAPLPTDQESSDEQDRRLR